MSEAFGAALVALLLSGCHPTPESRPIRSAAEASPIHQLQRDVDAILADPALQHGYWGVVAKSLARGDTLYSVNADKLMMPASNMKIVTLAAAAERLGWAYAYETSLWATTAVEGATLNGDLIVVGSGDPSFMAADGSADRIFAEWAGALEQRGVRAVAGRIVGDDRALDDRMLGFGWSWDDLADDYAAGVGALQLNENMVRVTVAPGPAVGESAGVSMTPAGGGFTLASTVTTGPAGSPPSIRVSRLPGSMRLDLRGTIAVDAAPAAIGVAVDNPTRFFVTMLRAALIANGIDVRGAAVCIDDLNGEGPPRRAAAIAAHKSAPLSALAMRLMKASQNQYAETFLKSTGAAGGAPSAGGGAAAVRQTLEPWGVQGRDLIQRDGSGLSRYDYVTPAALVAILTHVAGDETLRGPFQASLPIAGRDGSLANRMKGTAAEGNARAKTGSMSNVRALSGYVAAADGEPLAFSIIANNFDATPDVINRATDVIVVRLAQFRR
jgi:serine-type D-Ala-D-Ala carboxypeptidase/endopeptidase (penicillin-binding protein 4)